MIETFRKRFKERYQVLAEQKNKGKGLVSWVCTYVPEEIIEEAVSLTTMVDVPLHTITSGARYEQDKWSVDLAFGYRFGGREIGGDKFHFDAITFALAFGYSF